MPLSLHPLTLLGFTALMLDFCLPGKVWDAQPAGEQRRPAAHKHSTEQRAEEDERADDRDGESEPVHRWEVQTDGGVGGWLDAWMDGCMHGWITFLFIGQIEVKEARNVMVEANNQEYAFNYLQQSLNNRIQDAEVHWGAVNVQTV